MSNFKSMQIVGFANIFYLYLIYLLPFPYENHLECYKKLASRSWPVLFTLIYFFLYIHSPVLLQNKKFLRRLSQIVCMVTTININNIHASKIMHTQKSMHSIDSSMLKLFEFDDLSIFFFALCLDDFIM